MHRISYSELIVLGGDIVGNMKALIERGAQHVELMMDGGAWDAWDGQYAGLIAQLKQLPLTYTLHPAAWDINLTAEMKILREAAYRHHLDALRLAAQLGAGQLVLHPGFSTSPAFSKPQARQRAADITGRLAVEAKALGVALAFENVGYNGQSLYTQQEFEHALDPIDAQVSYLIDLGHAHINGWDLPALIRKLGPRLCAVHIHDNDGLKDQHLPIGKGTIDWQPVLAEMKAIPNPGCEFILEYAPAQSLESLSAGKEILESHHCIEIGVYS